MRRDQLPQHKSTTYVMPAYKAAYIAVNKSACTSLKWLVADVQGEDPERFYTSISREVTREMCIHRRSLWRHTPSLYSLPDDQLAEVSPDNGWFIFTVVRHPAARLFSGWQSKFLLREPRWVDEFGRWVTAIPQSSDEIVEQFRAFALAVGADPDTPLMHDRHFMSQWRQAAPERVPYSRLYDTSEIGQLMQDFTAHVRGNGYEGEIRLRQTNETPLRPLASMFTDDVREAIRGLYADDFEHLGYDDVVPPKLAPGDAYPDTALQEVVRLIERNERIGDLAMRAQELSAAQRDARTKLKAAAGKAVSGNGSGRPLRAAAGRLRRRITGPR